MSTSDLGLRNNINAMGWAIWYVLIAGLPALIGLVFLASTLAILPLQQASQKVAVPS